MFGQSTARERERKKEKKRKPKRICVAQRREAEQRRMHHVHLEVTCAVFQGMSLDALGPTL